MPIMMPMGRNVPENIVNSIRVGDGVRSYLLSIPFIPFMGFGEIEREDVDESGLFALLRMSVVAVMVVAAIA